MYLWYVSRRSLLSQASTLRISSSQDTYQRYMSLAAVPNLSPPRYPVRHFPRLPGREARAQSLVPGSVRSLSARGGDIPSSGRAIARATRHKVTTVLAPRRFRCVARKGRRSNLRVRETRQVTHTHSKIRPVRSPAHLSYRQADTPWRSWACQTATSCRVPSRPHPGLAIGRVGVEGAIRIGPGLGEEN